MAAMHTPDKVQDLWRDWLRMAIRQSGLKPTPFAEETGVAPSTITNALDEGKSRTITVKTIEKVVARWHIPPPGGLGLSETNGVASHEGFQEEVQRFEGAAPKGVKNDDDPNRSNWEIRSRALALAGYMPGDIVTIDQAISPRHGDIVVAQIYDLHRGTADTVIRRYHTGRALPYLMAAAMDAEAMAIPPEFVDNERVKVLGTVIRSVRLRP